MCDCSITQRLVSMNFDLPSETRIDYILRDLTFKVTIILLLDIIQKPDE